ncbi:hypothetical protein [Streptomyces canus]|uniref:hypothetical protein n=1 Tax=Streptomyces TaxID=1883 RepID=UPI0036E40FAB
MTDKNEKLKPPARRTTGRTLGGAKKTTPPPPPPAAELTAEQFAAERDAAEPQASAGAETETQPSAATAPHEKRIPDRVETSTPSPEHIAPPLEQGENAATSSPGSGLETRQVHAAPMSPVGVAPTVTEQAPPSTPTPHTAVPVTAAVAAEVAVRQAVAPATSSTTFPLGAGAPLPQQEQQFDSGSAPSDGPPWTQGPGRPHDIPETAVVLNQRIIARESLDASVPAALRLKRRIKRFALDNELDHLPIGDILCVALDDWLTARGF